MNSIKLRGIVAAVSGAVMFAAMPAMADSTDDIINALMAKGVLTEEEGALLMRGRTGEKEAAEAKKKSEVKAAFKDGLVFESGDKSFKAQVNGRVHADYRWFDYRESNVTGAGSSSTGADTFDIRRARLGLKVNWKDYYEAEVVGDFSSSAKLDVGYLNIAWWKPVQFRFGQFKMPMNLEELTSSNNIDFMERSFVNSMAPAKEIGAMVHGQFGKGFTYALAASNGAGQNTAETDNRVDNKDYLGRVTANFAEMMGNQDMVLHAGLSYSRGDMGESSDSVKIGVDGSTEARGAKFFTAQSKNLVDNKLERRRTGIEGAVAYGPVKLQSEWLKTNYEFTTTGTGATDGDLDIKAWYAEALWLVTGEKYADFYKNGAWGGIKPKADFDPSGKNGWGAWELGLRYSRFDADDGFKPMGSMGYLEANAWTAGIKFLPTANTRLMLNYVKTDFENKDSNVTINNKSEDSERAVIMRAQWMF